MKDLLLVIQHIFTWKFLLILSSLLIVGLRLPDAYSKPFRSVRFNVWLFLIIAIASSIGTFNSEWNVYHTWWFSGLLALMAFDVVVCKLRNNPVFYERRQPDISLGRTTLKKEFSSAYSFEDTASHIQDWMRAKKFRWSLEKNQEAWLFTTGRQRIQRWGDFVLHISIVIILAGNVMGALFGFEEVLAIKEHETVTMRNRPYTVSLKDFDIEYYRSTGSPSLYASDLSVTENGLEIAHKRIVVNDPLDIDRVRFYQSSWGMTTDFRSATLQIGGQPFELAPHVATVIPGTPLSIRANEFLPSFQIDAQGQPTTVDFEGRNPALQIDFLQNNKVTARLWLLKNQPEMAFRINGNQVIQASAPPFQLLDVDPVLFSGIQVGYDPGAPLFWFGSIILLIGLSAHFYLHQRRLQILITLHGKKAVVAMGGWNSRSPEDFEDEFNQWSDEILKVIS